MTKHETYTWNISHFDRDRGCVLHFCFLRSFPRWQSLHKEAIFKTISSTHMFHMKLHDSDMYEALPPLNICFMPIQDRWFLIILQISRFSSKTRAIFFCCYPLGRASTKTSKLRTALFEDNHGIHSAAFTFPWQLTGAENCIDEQTWMSVSQCKNNFASHDKLETGNSRRVKTQQGQKGGGGALFWHSWFGCAGIFWPEKAKPDESS